MAFQFVPNADGSFDEGMRQTNPETGVEYLHTDGAWRPLGPKIEDQFTELDERYVQKAGDTMEGRLVIVKEGLRFNKEDGTRQLTISPNNGDYYTNLFAHNGSGLRLRAAPDDGTTGYKTGVSLNWNTHTVGSTEYPLETNINYLKTPTAIHHAANKQYVDDEIANAVSNSSTITIPGRRYKYSNSYDSSLPSGCFHVEGSGNIQLSRFDFDGVEMASTHSDSWTSSTKFAATVRSEAGYVKHSIACDKWYQGRDSNKHIRYVKSTMIKDGKSSLSAGTVYWIADGIYCI